MEWKHYKERMHVYFPMSREGKLLHVRGAGGGGEVAADAKVENAEAAVWKNRAIELHICI